MGNFGQYVRAPGKAALASVFGVFEGLGDWVLAKTHPPFGAGAYLYVVTTLRNIAGRLQSDLRELFSLTGRYVYVSRNVYVASLLVNLSGPWSERGLPARTYTQGGIMGLFDRKKNGSVGRVEEAVRIGFSKPVPVAFLDPESEYELVVVVRVRGYGRQGQRVKHSMVIKRLLEVGLHQPVSVDVVS